MSAAFAIGIDPGPTTGIVLLHLQAPGGLAGSAGIYQCNASAAPWLLAMMLGKDGINGAPARGGIEAFARGRGAGARKRAGRATADQVAELTAVAAGYGVRLTQRNAGMVKPWATDKRLGKAGLLDLVPGSTHAKDAARHALYCAVRDCGLPDPLSSAWRPGRGAPDGTREKPG